LGRFDSKILDRLEGQFNYIYSSGGVSKEQEAKERRMIRESAIHSNRCGHGEEFGVSPLFDVQEFGVYSNVDGKPITRYTQTLAELWYWQAVLVYGPLPYLIHDEEEQAFYTHHGEVALSRDHVNLSLFLGPACECDACMARRLGRLRRG
jgi:hypothetical protein